MDWIRANKVPSAILGIILIGIGGLGYVLFSAWESYSKVREDYTALGTQIASIKGMSLAPTQQNLQAKQGLVEEYAANVNKLGGALVYLQPVPPPVKQAEFQSKLKERVLEAKSMASSLKVGLPAEFSLGFNEYLGSLPNSDTTATELSGYLDGIEAITKLVMNCRVKSIDLLDRMPLPIEKDVSKQPALNTAKKKSGPGVRQSGAPVPLAISEKRQVTMVVTLDQGALQSLMSQLANPVDMKVKPDVDQSYFASLRLIRVENQSKEGPIRRAGVVASADPVEPDSTNKPAATNKDGKDAPSGPVILTPPPPAPADSVPVIGQELLKVQMEIDLVKFLDAARGVAVQQSVAPRQ